MGENVFLFKEAEKIRFNKRKPGLCLPTYIFSLAPNILGHLALSLYAFDFTCMQVHFFLLSFSHSQVCLWVLYWENWFWLFKHFHLYTRAVNLQISRLCLTVHTNHCTHLILLSNNIAWRWSMHMIIDVYRILNHAHACFVAC